MVRSAALAEAREAMRDADRAAGEVLCRLLGPRPLLDAIVRLERKNAMPRYTARVDRSGDVPVVRVAEARSPKNSVRGLRARGALNSGDPRDPHWSYAGIVGGVCNLIAHPDAAGAEYHYGLSRSLGGDYNRIGVFGPCGESAAVSALLAGRLFERVEVDRSRVAPKIPKRSTAGLPRPVPPVRVCRIGDFYEAFDDDAVRLSKLYGLTLTCRGETPMCGFPFHMLDRVEGALVGKGVGLVVVPDYRRDHDHAVDALGYLVNGGAV